MKNFKRFILMAAILFIIAAVKTNSQPININENDISFKDSTTAILVGQDGLIMRTEDGGLNWSVVLPGFVTNSFNASDYIAAPPGGPLFPDTLAASSNFLFGFNSLLTIVGDNGIVMFSPDNGVSWIVSASGTLENLNDVYIQDYDAIYACGDNGTLIFTSDRGTSWTPIQTNTTANLNSIEFSTALDNTNALIAGDNGVVLITHDNGLTWLISTTNTLNNLNTVVMAHSDLMVAAGDAGTILRSIDSGLTWESVITDYTGIVYDIKYLDGEFSDIFAASGENGVVLRSENLGVNWSIIETGSTSDLFALNFYNSTNGISVGENGTELYTLDGGLTWVSIETTDNIASFNKKPIDVKLNQNYPNPFNPSTIISYELPFDAKVSIKVYDMLGRVVANLLSANQLTGTHSVSFNASGLSSGVYFYKLNAESGNNSFSKVMKMILTK